MDNLLNYTQTALLAHSAQLRNVDVSPRILDAAWQDADLTVVLVGETSDGLIRCVRSDGFTVLKSWSVIQSAFQRAWTTAELMSFIGQKLNYDGFHKHENQGVWTCTFEGEGQTFTATDVDETVAIAKAIVVYLDGGGKVWA